MRARQVRIEKKITEAPVLSTGATFIHDNTKYKLLTIQRIDVDYKRGIVIIVGTGRPLAGYHGRVSGRERGEMVGLSVKRSVLASPIGD
jgi:hypothetical protein